MPAYIVSYKFKKALRREYTHIRDVLKKTDANAERLDSSFWIIVSDADDEEALSRDIEMKLRHLRRLKKLPPFEVKLVCIRVRADGVHRSCLSV